MTIEEIRNEAKKRATKCIEYACGRIVGNPDFVTEQFVEFADMVMKNRWHKASEELPKEHAPSIIVFKFKGEWIYDVGYLVKDEWNSNLLESYDVVEYWMPIPELPKEG